MTLSIYTLPTTYVHDIFGALPQRYVTIDGVIQGCGIATETYCVAQEKAIHWITKTVEAAARGQRELPRYDEPPPEDVRTFLAKWLEDHCIRQPTEETSVVVTRHYADNGVYLVTPALAEHLPALAEKCMADRVKGLRYKPEWEAWSPSEVTLRDGDAWTFDLKKPEEGLILAGGECGPIDATIFLGHDNYIKAKLRKKAEKIRGYLKTLVSVVKQAAKAYHVERLAFRVLKYTARARARAVLPPRLRPGDNGRGQPYRGRSSQERRS